MITSLVVGACAAGGSSLGSMGAGGAGGATAGDGGIVPSSGGATGADASPGVTGDRCDALFAERVQPLLNDCRSCHSPGGIAEGPSPGLFALSQDATEDYENLVASWERLGKNNLGTSAILSMAAGTYGEPHSGGSPWTPGSDAFVDVEALLLGLENPTACDGGGSGAIETFPLLGSMRGGHYWFDFCEGKADGTPVPEDPRELIVPGVNADKAVYMNAFWQTCQDDNHPATCGDLRDRVERGYRLVAADGEVGAGTVFAGDGTSSLFVFPAMSYATLYLALGMLQRPDDFDELLAERWGTPLSETHNPYPLPGEDPNATDGGSGQLPMALTQLREPDGTWTGDLSVTCSVCHAGKVGDASDGPGLGGMYGTNSLSDITVMFADLGRVAPMMSALGIFALNKIRGTGNITNFQFFGMLELTGTPDALPDIISIQGEPSTGTEDPPVWWNLGHRSGKFFDGAQVADAKRIELSFHLPNAPAHGLPPGELWEEDKQWILDHQQDADAWITSLKSPAWPEDVLGAIDTTLAEQGAILFHNKDLWDESLDNPYAEPAGGNGSCASCHGAYSPRYVNDEAFLDTPLFEGMASHIVPLEVIGTDSRRLDGNSQAVVEASRAAWFAYSDGPFDENGAPLCGNWNDEELRGDRPLGYLAPPLYGVWATAPYFHNGSVPNIAEVLDPSGRKKIWRRVATPTPDGQRRVMGFSTALSDYDADKLGWKYDALDCGDGSTPLLDCNPGDSDETIQDTLGPVLSIGLAWNLINLPPYTTPQIEDRKVYNTNYYSQSNTGHEFTAVLTDDERRAIIEYLKTL